MSLTGKLKSSTAISGVQQQMLSALVDDNAEQEKVLEALFAAKVNDNDTRTKWQKLKTGEAALSLDDLASALQALNKSGFVANTDKIKLEVKSPLTHKEFLHALKEGQTNVAELKKQFLALRDEAKKEKGYLSKAFGVFSKEKPIEAVLENVASFEKYCHREGITFNDVSNQLIAGEKPKTAFDKISEFRFLIAAAGGGLTGLAGVNIMARYPVLESVPDMFFTGLPYFAVPFMGLSIFKAFSEKNISDEAGTFGRFATMMLGGFVIGAAITAVMSGILPDPAALPGAPVDTTAPAALPWYNPFRYIIHTMAGFAAFSGLYKIAKNKLKPEDEQAAELARKSKIRQAFSRAASGMLTKTAAAFTVAAGEFTKKAAHYGDKAFSTYMNFVALPAITLMMSNTFSQGYQKLAAYAGYYEVVGAAMGVCAASLATASFLYGARRWKDVKAIGKTVGTAFSLSSGVATMPTTKASLKIMGVPSRIRESVVPLSANFNMLGTSLYMGTTVFAASAMFGQPMEPLNLAATAAMVALHGYGAPGVPASNISLLAPVMGLTGLSNGAIKKMYEVVIPGDRILDMSQTALNVWGDMMIALGKYRREIKTRAKNIKKIRTERQKAAVSAPAL